MPDPDKPAQGGNTPADGASPTNKKPAGEAGNTPAGGNQQATDKPAEGSNKVTTNIREVEELRIKAAFWLATVGLGLAGSLAFVLIQRWNPQNATSSDITSIVGMFTSVLGTLVGAFFGLQFGSAGTDRAQQQAADAQAQTTDANNKATAFAGAMDRDTLDKALDAYAKLSAK